MKKENSIQVKSYAFALRVVRMYRREYKNSDVKSLLRQVLDSSTSIGANVEEAEGGQSKRDFIAKMNISYKEARETRFWLRILRDAEVLKTDEANSLISDCEELLRFLTAILNTSKGSNS